MVVKNSDGSVYELIGPTLAASTRWGAESVLVNWENFGSKSRFLEETKDDHSAVEISLRPAPPQIPDIAEPIDEAPEERRDSRARVVYCYLAIAERDNLYSESRVREKPQSVWAVWEEEGFATVLSGNEECRVTPGSLFYDQGGAFGWKTVKSVERSSDGRQKIVFES